MKIEANKKEKSVDAKEFLNYSPNPDVGSSQKSRPGFVIIFIHGYKKLKNANFCY